MPINYMYLHPLADLQKRCFRFRFAYLMISLANKFENSKKCVID